MPEFEPLSTAECRAIVRAVAFDKGGTPLTSSDGIKAVTVRKLVNRGLMTWIEGGAGQGWAARVTDDGRVVANALTQSST